jgi:hypothetical protein
MNLTDDEKLELVNPRVKYREESALVPQNKRAAGLLAPRLRGRTIRLRYFNVIRCFSVSKLWAGVAL